MTTAQHYRGLKSAYHAAKINEFYGPDIEVGEGACSLSLAMDERFFHSLGAAHGSVYFKMLDDAAFFACMSLETEFVILTTSFTTYLTRPISEGSMTATGKVVNQNKTQFIAESIVYDDQQREIGRGNGIFTRTKATLDQLDGYHT